MIPDELKGPTKKPRILPGKEIDMKSKKVLPFCICSPLLVNLWHSAFNLSYLYINCLNVFQFKQQLRSVLVDGADILAAARDACQKSSARQEDKDAAAKAKAKKEEERVAELKRIRGERWLPSIAREMQVKNKAKNWCLINYVVLDLFCCLFVTCPMFFFFSLIVYLVTPDYYLYAIKLQICIISIS